MKLHNRHNPTPRNTRCIPPFPTGLEEFLHDLAELNPTQESALDKTIHEEFLSRTKELHGNTTSNLLSLGEVFKQVGL